MLFAANTVCAVPRQSSNSCGKKNNKKNRHIINCCLTTISVCVGLISGLTPARPLSALHPVMPITPTPHTQMAEPLSIYTCVHEQACMQASLVFLV